MRDTRSSQPQLNVGDVMLGLLRILVHGGPVNLFIATLLVQVSIVAKGIETATANNDTDELQELTAQQGDLFAYIVYIGFALVLITAFAESLLKLKDLQRVVPQIVDEEMEAGQKGDNASVVTTYQPATTGDMQTEGKDAFCGTQCRLYTSLASLPVILASLVGGVTFPKLAAKWPSLMKWSFADGFVPTMFGTAGAFMGVVTFASLPSLFKDGCVKVQKPSYEDTMHKVVSFVDFGDRLLFITVSGHMFLSFVSNNYALLGGTPLLTVEISADLIMGLTGANALSGLMKLISDKHSVVTGMARAIISTCASQSRSTNSATITSNGEPETSQPLAETLINADDSSVVQKTCLQRFADFMRPAFQR